MQQQIKMKDEIVLNKEIANLFIGGVDEILDSLELMMNPQKLMALNKRIVDIKKRKSMKSMGDFTEFIKKEGIDLDKIKNEL